MSMKYKERDFYGEALGRTELTETEVQLLYFFQTDFNELSDFLTNENRSTRSLTDITDSEAQGTVVSSSKNPDDFVSRIDRSVIQVLQDPVKICDLVSDNEIGVVHAQYVTHDQTKSTESPDIPAPPCSPQGSNQTTLTSSTKSVSKSGVNGTSFDSTIEVLTSESSAKQSGGVSGGHQTNAVSRHKLAPWYLLLGRLPLVVRTSSSSTFDSRSGVLQRVRKIFRKE
ncbi:uncharacterized protein LOC111132384 [Crassostrea virginica]